MTCASACAARSLNGFTGEFMTETRCGLIKWEAQSLNPWHEPLVSAPECHKCTIRHAFADPIASSASTRMRTNLLVLDPIAVPAKHR